MPSTDSRKLLRDLVAIPSVNNAFLPPGDPHCGEERVSEYLAASAASGGLDVEFQKVLPRRSNLFARLTPSNRIRQRIVLAPHMDTVGEPGMSGPLFDPREKNGRLHGRGACDTKGSVAAMLSALLNVAVSGARPRHTELIFIALVDEEHGQLGSWNVVKRGFKADLAIVGEPTQLRVVTAHKGDVWLRLETHGLSSHGARPELGRNAVHEMARIVDLLESKYASELRRRRHELLGCPTINVGSIRGGTQPNIVPDHCEISIDRRTIPGETEPSVRAEIKSLLRANQLEARFANIKLSPCLPLETNPDLPLVRRILNHARQKKPEGVDFFCDASVLAHGGIPSVVFGPGDIAQAHTADEWIEIESLGRAARFLTRFLRSLP